MKPLDEKVLESFRVYEDGKHRRYSLLFAVNGGAFAVAKILVDKSADPILGHLSLRELSFGMVVFTIVMSVDIFMVGAKMRKSYLPDAFGWQGKLVLALLGTLLCAGWFLAV